MDTYDPSIAPDPADWQALEETEQIYLVEEFHIESQEPTPEGGTRLHAGIHVIVENQIAMGVRPVPETIAKLMRQGLDRHEAIHAVGAILTENVYELLNTDEGSWNAKQYRRRLDKLTARRWKKGQW